MTARVQLFIADGLAQAGSRIGGRRQGCEAEAISAWQNGIAALLVQDHRQIDAIDRRQVHPPQLVIVPRRFGRHDLRQS